MPITEVVRVLATATGRHGDGRAVEVRLAYDVDGSLGADEAAIGYPAWWLRVAGGVHGPFEHEGDAIEAARERWGAIF